MNWSAAQQIRLDTERTILARYFPQLEWHDPTDPDRTHVQGEIAANSGASYALRLDIPATYPATCPAMVVPRPAPLRDHDGRPLTEPDRTMHTLAALDDATRISHCHPARWVPSNTLYLVALKGRIWLEAYETHLRTGEPIETYLRRIPWPGAHPARPTGRPHEGEGI
ncbi:hypothetical protein [Nocardia bovistercoris]|uniref:Uncharacterized protein n=1 Tax=Nocardia bovistercoris TaxID=2785916 RepID=A0A931N2C0_9NOCA|nr:hypothetical protein [Nocardia bovistercoris]MBH0776587.1 hypothetical protein [Nocardia bovistercoris]